MAKWNDFETHPVGAAERLKELEAGNATRQQNMRTTFDAMCAMRNSINEIIPMPSLESDLLQGPENSVFCAVVAEAVCGAFRKAEAEIERLEKEVEEAREGWNVETPNIQALLDTVWNDAIEAAAKMLNFDEACVDAHVKLWAKDRMEVVRAIKRPTP